MSPGPRVWGLGSGSWHILELSPFPAGALSISSPPAGVMMVGRVDSVPLYPEAGTVPRTQECPHHNQPQLCPPMHNRSSRPMSETRNDVRYMDQRGLGGLPQLPGLLSQVTPPRAPEKAQLHPPASSFLPPGTRAARWGGGPSGDTGPNLGHGGGSSALPPPHAEDFSLSP